MFFDGFLIIGFVTDTHSIDYIKKKYPADKSLVQFYKNVFGDNFDRAQRNFIESLAGYSIICYLLQIKDRCN
jgi:phosphatidylinositol 4-kinase